MKKFSFHTPHTSGLGFTRTLTYAILRVWQSILHTFNKWIKSIYPNRKQTYCNNASRRLVSGFTLIEILLTLGLLAIVAGIMAPVAISVLSRNNLSIAAKTVEETLHTAETFAKGGVQDSPWGVHLEKGSVLLFAGESVDTRNKDLDETSDIASTVTFTGINDIVFMKGSGVPSTAGSITLSLDSDTTTLTINETGAILKQ